MRRSPASRFASLALASLFALVASATDARIVRAQQDPANAKPGRNPSQPIDEAYTKKIKEYTTEPFFLSPLVDYMPAAKGVPTPTAVLGDIAGNPHSLPHSKEVYEYMRLLAKSTPRVKVLSIGTTEEGREMIAVAVASDQLMARLDANKANLAKLADPRTIGMNDAEADRIALTAAPVYYITGTIHSTESGAPTALMELAYRLAVDESPYVRNIRDHVITLITPIVEVDGRDREADLVNYHLKHPNEVVPSLIYWGHYVAHDNNRDAMGATLKLTQNVLNTYVDWKAQILHDLHESGSFLYDNTVGDGPYNAWLDPLVTNEWQLIGWNNVQEMTRFGMPGVFAHGTFDTWSPGYLMFIAATHNGISRLYETFGNGGSPEVVDRTLSPNETERTWYRQNPPLAHVKWDLRDNNNYEQTGILVSLSYVANNRVQLLRNFYEKSKRSILKPKTEGPAAYVLSANDPRPGAQAELLRVLQRQRVEVTRATQPFTVTIPAKRTLAAGRGGRGAGRGNAPADATVTTQSGGQAETSAQQAGDPRGGTREFPAGSYIIRMDQPYSRIADAILDYQYWSPNDPQKNPYDDTGWTFPEGFAVQCLRVTDAKVLDVPSEKVTGTVTPPGGVSGAGETFLINHNGDNALITLRYKLKDANFQIAEEPFDANGQHYNRGSFIVSGVSQSALDAAAKSLGVKVAAVASAPSVKTHAGRAPRVAILHTWAGTQTEGWWRQAFDFNEVPYDYISVQDVAANATLNAKYDVIVFPPAGGNGQSIIDGMPMWRNPMPWKSTAETPNIGTWAQTDDVRPGLGWAGLEHLSSFVKSGGVLVTSTNTAEFAIDYGLTNGVSSSTARRLEVDGTLLRAKIVDDASPIVYGVPDNLAVFTKTGQWLTVSNTRGGGGRGGAGGFGAGGAGRGGAGAARATGRGTPDDADTPQGRPASMGEGQYLAPQRPQGTAWSPAPLTDDAFRNPLNIIPPEQRPRVALRYADQRDLFVSGLMDGGQDLAQRPVVVDSPLEKGHVVLFANNPVYRGETIGNYFMVYNTLLNWDNLNAGRKLDPR